MYEEPEEDATPERPADPAQRAKEKGEEFRIHAELAAVFEGPRKFDAEIRASLDVDVARGVQRTIAKLEKAKTPESPILPPEALDEARRLLKMPASGGPGTHDYHVHRRPGEVMIVRWLEGEQADTFYERAQAHFDAALEGFKEDERQAKGWKQDGETAAYLKALDGVQVNMADRYLRGLVREHRLFVLSTVTADEMDILHLCEYLMGVEPARLVGAASAPPAEDPTEQDRAWFFKLFSLRGVVENVERMCFFTFMQKAEDTFDVG